MTLVDADALAVELRRTFAAADAGSVDAACTDAEAACFDFIGTDDIGDLPDYVQFAVAKVAKRVASRFFLNPEDRASYAGPEGLSYQMAPTVSARILTQDEREALTSAMLLIGGGFA